MISKIWGGWKKLAEKIGNFQASVIFSLLFYILVTPIGLLMGFFSDPLRLRNKPKWSRVLDNSGTLKKMSKQ